MVCGWYRKLVRYHNTRKNKKEYSNSFLSRDAHASRRKNSRSFFSLECVDGRSGQAIDETLLLKRSLSLLFYYHAMPPFLVRASCACVLPFIEFLDTDRCIKKEWRRLPAAVHSSSFVSGMGFFDDNITSEKWKNNDLPVFRKIDLHGGSGHITFLTSCGGTLL